LYSAFGVVTTSSRGRRPPSSAGPSAHSGASSRCSTTSTSAAASQPARPPQPSARTSSAAATRKLARAQEHKETFGSRLARTIGRVRLCMDRDPVPVLAPVHGARTSLLPQHALSMRASSCATWRMATSSRLQGVMLCLSVCLSGTGHMLWRLAHLFPLTRHRQTAAVRRLSQAWQQRARGQEAKPGGAPAAVGGGARAWAQRVCLSVSVCLSEAARARTGARCAWVADVLGQQAHAGPRGRLPQRLQRRIHATLALGQGRSRRVHAHQAH
jgi:hypothetical protein